MTAADMVQAVSDDAGGGLEAARPVSSLSAAQLPLAESLLYA